MYTTALGELEGKETTGETRERTFRNQVEEVRWKNHCQAQFQRPSDFNVRTGRMFDTVRSVASFRSA